MSTDVAKVVVLVWSEHWDCVLLRAELIERGYDATCRHDLTTALLYAVVSPRRSRDRASSVVAMVIDLSALTPRDRPMLAVFRAITTRPSLILLTGAFMTPIEGPWAQVLRRPVPIGAVADAVEEIVADRVQATGGGEAHHGTLECEGFRVRLGPPWPMILCGKCAASRNYQVPRSPREEATIQSGILLFVQEHASCARDGASWPGQTSNRTNTEDRIASSATNRRDHGIARLLQSHLETEGFNQ